MGVVSTSSRLIRWHLRGLIWVFWVPGGRVPGIDAWVWVIGKWECGDREGGGGSWRALLGEISRPERAQMRRRVLARQGRRRAISQPEISLHGGRSFGDFG
jgi:hypothetical protein